MEEVQAEVEEVQETVERVQVELEKGWKLIEQVEEAGVEEVTRIVPARHRHCYRLSVISGKEGPPFVRNRKVLVG